MYTSCCIYGCTTTWDQFSTIVQYLYVHFLLHLWLYHNLDPVQYNCTIPVCTLPASSMVVPQPGPSSVQLYNTCMYTSCCIYGCTTTWAQFSTIVQYLYVHFLLHRWLYHNLGPVQYNCTIPVCTLPAVSMVVPQPGTSTVQLYNTCMYTSCCIYGCMGISAWPPYTCLCRF